jgi:hypothetical protein
MSDDLPHLKGRCGTCARFVRTREVIDANGEVTRVGECLLNVWPSPLKETATCGYYLLRGTVHLQPKKPPPRAARPRGDRPLRDGGDSDEASYAERDRSFVLPEELLDMTPEEFRAVLRDVIRDELGAGDVELGGRWSGGEVILKPGKEGTAEKRIPLESFFHKIVMIRDKLRVLEQRINAHPKLSDEEKVQMQQYVTGCYGTLTTFNVLFAAKDDGFTGAGGKGDD